MHFYVPSKLKLYSISAINKMATDWPRSGSKLILLLILYSSGVFFSFFFFFLPIPMELVSRTPSPAWEFCRFGIT